MKNRFVIITKKVICVIVCVTISHFTRAQYKITGYLNDLRSTPVEAASIILLNDSSGKVIKTSISDAKGYFLLDRLKKQNYKLRITSVNTRDTLLLVSRAENDTVKLAIVLVDKNRLTTNVVVNSSRPMIQVKLGKIVFSPESMIGATGDNALGLLQKTPLVSVTDAGEISVKGGSVGIMLNGRLLRIGTNELREMLRSIPASEVDYIEVITTPSSKYDAEGTSALLNIVLKKSKLLGVNGSITPTIEQTSYTRGYLPFSINYRDKKTNFFGSVTINDGRSYSINQLDNIFSRNTIPYYSYGYGDILRKRYSNYNRAGIDYSFTDNKTLGLRVDQSNGTFEGNEKSNTVFQKKSVPTDSAYQSAIGSSNRYHTFSANINYKAILPKSKSEWVFNLDYYRYKMPENVIATKTAVKHNPAPPNDTVIAFQTQTSQIIDIYSGQVDYSKTLRDSTLMELGTKAYFLETKNNMFFYDGLTPVFNNKKSQSFYYREKSYAAYVNFSKQITKKIGVQAGVRLENQDIDGSSTGSTQMVKRRFSKLYPTILFQYTADADNQYSISYNSRTKRPNYSYLNPARYYTNPYSYTEGNPFLLPSISHNIDINYTLKRKYTFDIFLFLTQNQITQTTVQDTASKSYRYQFVNIQHSYFGGLQSFIPLTIKKWWRVNNTVLFLFNGVDATVDGKSYIYNNINLQLQTSNQFVISVKNKWFADLNFIYQPPGMSQGQFISDAVANLSTGIRKIFNDQRSTLVFNITDVLNRGMVPVRVETASQYTRTYGNNDLRGVRLTYIYQFGKLTVRKNRNIKASNEDEKSRSN